MAQSNSLENSKFYEFIDDMELINLPTVDNKFTWFNVAGLSMSKLDWFLTSKGLLDSWKLKGQLIGNRVILGHYLILIKANGAN